MRLDGMARRAAAVAVVAVFGFSGATASPALAHKDDRAAHRAVAAERKVAAAERKAAARQRKAAAQAERKARFVVVGRVVSVTGDSLTLWVKGGNRKALKGREVTVKVPAGAKVTRGDAPATLASVTAGDHAAVKGRAVGEDLVASAVHASPQKPDSASESERESD